MKKQGTVGTQALKTKPRKRQTKTTILVNGETYYINWAELSKAEAQKIIKSGIEYGDLLELVEPNHEFTIGADAKISVNGKAVNYDTPNNHAKVRQVGNAKSWVITMTRGEKYEILKEVIRGKFDPAKLHVEPDRFCIGKNMQCDGISVTYDGKELDCGSFECKYDCKDDEFAIHSPQGKSFEFDISTENW